jgi:hypothetical protein
MSHLKIKARARQPQFFQGPLSDSIACHRKRACCAMDECHPIERGAAGEVAVWRGGLRMHQRTGAEKYQADRQKESGSPH